MERLAAESLKARVRNDFTNHPPADPNTAAVMDEVTARCTAFAEWIVDHVPAGREQSLALTQLEQTSMWAKAGIARNQG